MDEVRKANLTPPEESYEFELGRAESSSLGDLTVGRSIAEPGWRWSEHVKPIVKTEWCQSRHLGYLARGRMHVLMKDGSETDIEPGDFFDIPPGHDAWVLGDEATESIEWIGMRGWISPLETLTERVLATIVFTDIVDSTALAVRLGDRGWRETLARHEEHVRDVLGLFRGREVKSTGDGFLAVFDGAARALRCADALVSAAESDGLSIRAGVHTGEVEWSGDDVRGLAVHEASRIIGLAKANEVLLTSITKELAAGSGMQFKDLGLQQLKGLEPRQVFMLSR